MPQQSQYGYQNGGIHSSVQNVPIQSQTNTQFEFGNVNQSFGQSHEPLSPSFSRVDNSSPSINPNLGYIQTPNQNVNPQNLIYNLNANNP